MVELIDEYLALTNDGTKSNPKADRIMNKFFTDYADKIIKGIIHSPLYRYYQFGEMDDLINEGRMHIYSSIIKRQWNPEKGATIFSFLSTVVSKNLLTYTLKQNKDRNHKSDQEIETIFNNEGLYFNENFDLPFMMKGIFTEMKNHFGEKEKMVELTNLLEQYYETKIYSEGRKFIKKDFIEYAKARAFSPSLVNTFFSRIKKIYVLRDFL